MRISNSSTAASPQPSAGALRCGLCRTCPDNHTHRALSIKGLVYQFNNHRDIENRQPTALVYVTDRPLEALNRALSKHHQSKENADTIFIITIRVPREEDRQQSSIPIHANKLAQRNRGRGNGAVFKHEYLFERGIPENYVLHRVSLKTLIDRKLERLLGLDLHEGLEFPSFSEMRDALVDKVIRSRHPSGTGRLVGNLAWAIYAEECTYELAFRVMLDCFGRHEIDEDGQYVYLDGLSYSGCLDFSDICVIEEGIRDKLDAYLASDI